MHRAQAQPSVENLQTAMEEVVRQGRFLAGVRRLGLAVSGGSDSVALLVLLLPILRKGGVVPVVLHFNHGLRGKASDADARFVRELAANHGIACRAATGHPAVGRGRSLEMAAREARLDFFFACARTEALDAIATGHQADDVAETLLLRLARGAGASGLAGLRPCSILHRGAQPLRLIRPLLGFTRQTLRDWLRDHQIPWREDASNADTRIGRNDVRHTLLPQLAAQFGPGIGRRINQSAEILRAEDDFLEALAREWLSTRASQMSTDDESPALPIPLLSKQPLAMQRRIVRLWLLRQGLTAAAGFAPVEAILALLDRPTTGSVTLPGNRRLVCRAGRLRLLPAPAEPPVVSPPDSVRLPVPGAVTWRELTVTATLAMGIERSRAAMGVWPVGCSLDREAVGDGPLTLRARRPGDRIAPLGLQGSRRIQDLFVDAKVPREARDAIPLLCRGETIVWVPGYRVARGFAVRDEALPAVQIRVEC